jgi:radical SAM protein with 4Fe4S-binding SPASM domain
MGVSFLPYLVAWNLTRRCNLRCGHCYLDADEREGKASEELTREEGFRMIDGIAEVNPAALLVLTGGEPLLRRDTPDFAEYAAGKGLMVVVGTNGILLDETMAQDLRQHGVQGVGISLDSARPDFHDRLRGRSGAWEGALRGIEACRRQGLPFQIHTTAMRENKAEIPEILALAHRLGTKVFHLFFLVCTGRGEGMADLAPEEYEELLTDLIRVQGEFPGMMVRAKCAPQHKRLLYQADPLSPLTRATGYDGGGCPAGTHYCRIDPRGDVTPCPYLPLSVGNVRREGFGAIWRESTVLAEFRNPTLKEKCGRCEFRLLCGGCRARPYALHGDYLGEDAWCVYEPKGGEPIPVASFLQEPDAITPELTLPWTPEARAVLERIPYFLRHMVVRGTERYAREQAIAEITPALLEDLRRKLFGTDRPVFRR